jgi:single-strand DNA-binding protein
MAGSLNKVQIIGNLGADPELKYTSASKAYCNISVATTDRWKDKSGQQQEKTEWHKATLWEDQAENAAKYLHKGSTIYLEGSLTTREYEDKDGNKRKSTEIKVARIIYLDKKEGGGGGGGSSGKSGGSKSTGRQNAEPPPGGDDDIPF